MTRNVGIRSGYFGATLQILLPEYEKFIRITFTFFKSILEDFCLWKRL